MTAYFSSYCFYKQAELWGANTDQLRFGNNGELKELCGLLEHCITSVNATVITKLFKYINVLAELKKNMLMFQTSYSLSLSYFVIM